MGAAVHGASSKPTKVALVSILLPISDLPITNDQTINANRCVIPVAKSPHDYQAFRISSHDTNRLAMVFDTLDNP